MTVLVTGHAGFIGSHLTRAMSAAGESWWGLDRRAAPADGRAFVADVCELPRLAATLQPIDEIIHLASPVGVRSTAWSADETFSEIAKGATAVARVAQQLGARVLFVSSSEVYGEAEAEIDELTDARPLSGYGRGKLEAECVLADSVEVTVVRPFNVYGPGQRHEFVVPTVIEKVMNGQPMPLVNGGRSVRQFTYVDDFVEAVMRHRARAAGGPAVNVAGPEASSIRDAALLVASIVGRTVDFVDVSPEEIGRNPSVEIGRRTVAPSFIGSWRPTTTLADGLRLTARAFDASIASSVTDVQ